LWGLDKAVPQDFFQQTLRTCIYTSNIETDVYLAFFASDSKSVLVYEEVESGTLGVLVTFRYF